MNIVDTLRGIDLVEPEDYNELYFFAERAAVLSAILYEVVEDLDALISAYGPLDSFVCNDVSRTEDPRAAARRLYERAHEHVEMIIKLAEHHIDQCDPDRDIQEAGKPLIKVANAHGGLRRLR